MLKLSRVLAKNPICQNIGAFTGITHHSQRLHIGETNVIGNVVDVNSTEYQVIFACTRFLLPTRNIIRKIHDE